MTPKEATEAVLFIALLLGMYVAVQTTAHALAVIGTFVMVAVQ